MRAKTPIAGRAVPFRTTFEAFVALLACSATAQTAEPPSLEELLRTERRGVQTELAVSTASRQSQSADLAPAVTHVISRQDIERLGLRSLADVLRRMPGLEVRRDFEFTRVAVRGIAPGDFNGRVLFLLDGLRLNENIYDGGQIDREFLIDISLIERVEFAPGPGSALYGSNALLGVVNVVTRRADSLAGPQLRVALSPRGERASRISYAQRLDDGSEWLSAFSMEREPHVRLTGGQTGEEAASLAPLEYDRVLRYTLAYRSGGLNLRAGGSDRTRGFAAYTPVNAIPAAGTDSIRTGYAHAVWDGNWQDWDLHAGLALTRLRYRNDLPDDEKETLRTDRFEALGQWWIGELRLTRAWGGPLGDAHSTSLGLDWQRDSEQRFRYVFLGEKPFDDGADSTRLGVFLQDEWRLAERQRLVLGVRHDSSRGGPSRWSPRAAWVWSPAAGQSLKLLWGTAFRAPNRFEISFVPGNGPMPLAPERLRTTELAWAGPARLALPGDWQWRASLFSSRLLQLIERGRDDYANEAPVSSRGLELGLSGRWGSGWQLQLDLEAQRNRSADGGRQAYSPSHTLKWALQVPLGTPEWRLGLSGWASSERRGGVRLPGFAQSQAELRWQPQSAWEAFLGVHNLGGRAYREATGNVGETPYEYKGMRWQLGWVWHGGGL